MYIQCIFIYIKYIHMKVLLYLSSDQVKKIESKFGSTWKWKDLVKYLTAENDMEYELVKETFMQIADIIKRNKWATIHPTISN